MKISEEQLVAAFVVAVFVGPLSYVYGLSSGKEQIRNDYALFLAGANLTASCRAELKSAGEDDRLEQEDRHNAEQGIRD